MSGSEASTTLLKWSRRGRDSRPEGVGVVLTAIAFAGALGFWLLGPTGLVLGPCVILAVMSDYLFGRQYELTDRDARTRMFFSLSSMAWSDVKRVIQTDSSLLLSPLSDETWRDSFRGVQLDLIPSIKDRAIEIVREQVPTEATYSVR